MAIDTQLVLVRTSATGNVGTGILQPSVTIFPRPARLLSVSLSVETAPTGADLIVDIQRNTVAAPQTFASIFGTVAQQAPRIVIGNKVLHPDLYPYAALSATQQQAVAASNPPGQLSGFKYNGFGFSYDFSTGTGGPRPTRYGAGAPAATVGEPGDWYIDTTNQRLYGPKQPASGVPAAGWPTGYTALTAFNAVPAATQSATGAVPTCEWATGTAFAFNVNQVGSTVTGAVLSATALFELY